LLLEQDNRGAAEVVMAKLAFRAVAPGALAVLDWILASILASILGGLGISRRPAPVLAPVRVVPPPVRRGVAVPTPRRMEGRGGHW
jgi:hypothetical protein